MNVDRYRSLRAVRAIWHGLYSPQLVFKATSDSAMAIFAIAVLLLAGTSTLASLNELNNSALKAESAQMRETLSIDKNNQNKIEPLEEHDVTLALGNSLFFWSAGLLLMAVLCFLVGRFMLDLELTFKVAMGVAGSVVLIFLAKELFNTIIQVNLGTVQYGLHLGSLISPVQNPILFSWLQRIDLFGLWAFVNLGAAYAGWGGLHRKYGYVMGVTLWVVVVCAFGVASVVGGILSRM